MTDRRDGGRCTAADAGKKAEAAGWLPWGMPGGAAGCRLMLPPRISSFHCEETASPQLMGEGPREVAPQGCGWVGWPGWSGWWWLGASYERARTASSRVARSFPAALALMVTAWVDGAKEGVEEEVAPPVGRGGPLGPRKEATSLGGTGGSGDGAGGSDLQ